jgi:ribosomal protein L37AE/L43A
MKINVKEYSITEAFPPENNRRLESADMPTVIYPQLYCPKCGSYEIGLRRLEESQAIWGCRDCSSDFTLEFPRQRRF